MQERNYLRIRAIQSKIYYKYYFYIYIYILTKIECILKVKSELTF